MFAFPTFPEQNSVLVQAVATSIDSTRILQNLICIADHIRLPHYSTQWMFYAIEQYCSCHRICKKKMSGEFSIVLLYWRILCTGISSKILRCLTFCFRPHNLNILLLSESTAYLLQASTKPGSQLLAQEFSTVNKLYHLTSFSCHSLQKPLITN